MAHLGPGARERDRGVALASFFSREVQMNQLRHGHAPGHIRDAARDAIEAWMAWDGATPEPTVEYEINCETHDISISQALGRVCKCTDIVPGDLFDEVQDALRDYGIKRQRTPHAPRLSFSTSRMSELGPNT
jgi:hypothetical protein